jgi:transcriptional regulator with XRE-family HTH domain
MARTGGEHAAFADAVRQLRIDRRISLDELAELTGHTKTWIREVERGAHIPSREAVTALAAALGTTASKLLARER